MALEHHRPDRIAKRGREDRGASEQLIESRTHVDPNRCGDAAEPERETGQTQAAGPFTRIEAQRQQNDERRRRGDDNRGQRQSRSE